MTHYYETKIGKIIEKYADARMDGAIISYIFENGIDRVSGIPDSRIDSLTQDALRMVREEKYETLITALGGGEAIRTIINTGNIVAAKEAIDTVLVNYMSEDSKYFLKECMESITKYDFKKEWQLTA